MVALLHDIGHYPFAHQFRISGEFPRHEDRTYAILESGELEERISRQFNRDVYHAMLGVMRSVNASENPEGKTDGDPDPPHYNVLRAIVSSSIDVDKLDYVNRDSWHCGVPYGQIVDRARFLSSLRIWWDVEGSPKLLLSDKGRVCAEALVFARYLMTSEVYWNHAVRSYAAMLSSAIDRFTVTEINEHLWDTDHDFLRWLSEDGKGQWFTDLVQSRTPYRRAFVHQRLGGGQTDDEIDTKLFELLELAAAGKKEVLSRIKKAVIDTLGIRRAKRHEIVLDIPQGMTRISGVKVLAEGHEEPGRAGPIFDAIGTNFDGFARKARIFVHPRFMVKRSVAESTGAVRRALVKEFKLT